MALSAPKAYSRKEVETILTSLPLEEKRWTYNYLHNMLFIPVTTTRQTNKRIVLTDELLQQARSLSVGEGYDVSADADDRGAVAAVKYGAV